MNLAIQLRLYGLLYQCVHNSYRLYGLQFSFLAEKLCLYH
jgi:hypothetical protein